MTGSLFLGEVGVPPGDQNLKVSSISYSYLCFLQLGFEEDFEGNNVLALLLSRQVDIAKLALAEWSTNVKVVQLPSLASTTHRSCLSTST